MASALIVFAERPHGFQWLGIGATVIGYYFFSVVGRREGIIFHRNRGILLINYKKEEAERLTAMLKAGNEKVIRDLIVVLDFGTRIAEGTPDAIKTNPDVIKAYLGALA